MFDFETTNILATRLKISRSSAPEAFVSFEYVKNFCELKFFVSEIKCLEFLVSLCKYFTQNFTGSFLSPTQQKFGKNCWQNWTANVPIEIFFSYRRLTNEQFLRLSKNDITVDVHEQGYLKSLLRSS